MKKTIGLFLVIVSLVFLISCEMSLNDEKKTNAQTNCEHDFTLTEYAGTCKDLGYTLKICKKCEYREKVYNNLYADHVLGEYVVTKDPTCEETGEKAKTCLTCGQVIETQAVDRKPHQLSDELVLQEATCQEPGQSAIYCQVCITVQSRAVLPKLDHTPSEPIVTVPPTCQTTGKQEIRCTQCDTLLVTQTVGACDHTYTIVSTIENNQRYNVYTCTVCKVSHKEWAEDIGLSAGAIYQLIKDATVEINAYDKKGTLFARGSGFFIDENGTLVTNYHVIQSAYSLKIISSDKQVYTVDTVLGFDKAKDLAILKINITDSIYLKIAEKNAQVGDVVYAIGNSLGLAGTFSSGIVSTASRDVNNMVDLLQVTTPISSGNSGGPLVNCDGEVVGVNTLTAVEGQNINFAVKIDKIKTISTENPITVQNLYLAKLDENAYDIISTYLIVYATSLNGTKYTVQSAKEPETQTSYGIESYISYDTSNSALCVQYDLISDNRVAFSIEMDIVNGAGSYYTYWYDYGYGQAMVSTMVKVGSTFESYEDSFDDAFTVLANRYSPTEEVLLSGTTYITKQEAAERIMYQSFVSMVRVWDAFLTEINTGVTVANFGFIK